MRARAAAALLVLAVLLLPSACAHANYYRSEPARGARLTEAPTQVSVTLSEPIDPRGSGLEVHDQQRRRVDAGDLRVQGGQTPILTVGLPSELPPGSYQATWTALSTVDGHVTSGTFGFALGGFEPPADVAVAQEYADASAVARVLAYIGYALAFGVLAFAWYVDPRPDHPRLDSLRRQLALWGSVLIFVGTAGLFAYTLNASGLGLRGFAQTEVGREFGLRVMVAAATAVVGIVAGLRGLGRRILVILGILLLLDAFGNSQFVHSAQRGWPATTIDLAHLVSVSVWLGGLVLFLHFILHASRHGTYADVVRVGARFSGIALLSVMVLGVTGLGSTFLILGTHPFRDPMALWTHPYGAYLAGKVVLFGAMLGLAGINRFIFLGKQPGPDARAPWVYDSLRPNRSNRGHAFSRAVGLEATLGIAVLVLAGFLTATSPPTSEAPLDSPGFRRLGYSDHYNVTLGVDPEPMSGRASNVSLQIELAHNGSRLEHAIRIRVTIVEANQNETGGETYTATHAGGGRWLVGDVLFTRDGPHEARIEIQTEDVYRETVTVSFPVAVAS